MPIADGNLYPARSYQREAVHFSFRFKPNGSSAVSASSQVGCKGVKVTRTGAGVFQINLGKKYPKLVSAQFTLLRSAAAPGHCFQVTSNTVATNGKLSVTYVENNAGTFGAADLAAHANCHIACHIVVANTGLDS